MRIERRQAMGAMRSTGAGVAALALLAAGTGRGAAGGPPAEPVVIRARVVDAAGKPVEAADVVAYSAFSLVRAFAGSRDPMDIGLPAETASAKTAPDGTARITGVSFQRHVLRVTAPGRGLALLVSAVAVEGGGPEVLVRLPDAVAVEGDVVDAAGKGIAGAAVAFGPARGLGLQDVEGGLGRVLGTTDPAGRFRLEGVPATRQPPRPEAWLDGQVLHVLPTPSILVSRSFGERPLARLRVTVGGGASVAGTAETARERKPLADARVIVITGEDTKEAATSAVLYATTSGPDGALRVGGVPKGWLVGAIAAAPGYFASSFSDVQQEILAGQTSRTIYDLDRTLTVAGRVLDPAGKPVVGAEIADWKGRLGETAASSDAEGRYRIAGIDRWRATGRPGSDGSGQPIVLVVRAPGLVQPHDKESFRLDSETVRPGAAAEVSHDIVLQPESSISGRVFGLDGKPLAGVRVACAGEDKKASELWFDVVTGTDGSYVLPGLDAGTLVVEAGEAGPQGSALQRAVLAAGERKAGVDLRLAAGPK